MPLGSNRGLADVPCYYCDQITAADPTYAGRPAAFDAGSEAPRCAWHWRFRCDHCATPGHFMARFFCPRSGRLLCREGGPVEIEQGRFLAWTYWWTLRCPDCGERHPSLDYAEYRGEHPWQRAPIARGEQRWLSTEALLQRYPRKRPARVPLDTVSDADVDATWSANADVWSAGYDERGDWNRKYQSDPILLGMLGDVQEQCILDAGSGNGYLARLMARRGAQVVAVENAQRFHEIALKRQQGELL